MIRYAGEQMASQANANVNKQVFGYILFNVKAYGAKGDGVTDDTMAVQACIDYANSVGGQTIYFPHSDTGYGATKVTRYYVSALENTANLNFIGDNAEFVGGYTGTISNMGAGAELKAETVTGLYNVVTGYGAKGDSGASNNYTPIQNAINDAEAAGGGIVYIPSASGKYHYLPELELPNDVYLIGAGADLVTLVYAGGESAGIKSKSGSDIRTQLLSGFRLEGAYLSGGGTEQFNKNSIVSKHSGKKYAFVSGVIRYNGGSGWYVQNDVDHKPIGISSVGVVGDAVRINYDFSAKNVVSLLITPDDVLAAKGYTVAGSGVGLSASDFRFSRLVDMYGRAAYTGSAWVFADTTNTAQYNMTFADMGGGIIRVNHSADDVGLLPTMLTGFLGSHLPQVYNFDGTYFDVQFFDKATGAAVTTFDTQCKFMFRRGGYTMPPASGGYPYSDGNFWAMGLMEV